MTLGLCLRLLQNNQQNLTFQEISRSYSTHLATCWGDIKLNLQYTLITFSQHLLIATVMLCSYIVYIIISSNYMNTFTSFNLADITALYSGLYQDRHSEIMAWYDQLKTKFISALVFIISAQCTYCHVAL